MGLLIAAYPQEGIEAATADVYVGVIAGLHDPDIGLASVQALIKHAKRFPSIADIAEVYVNTRERMIHDRAERRGLVEGVSNPAPPIPDFDDEWWQRVVVFSQEHNLTLPPREVVAANSVAGREMRALLRARLRMDEVDTPLGTVMLQLSELVKDRLDTRALCREDFDEIHKQYPRWKPADPIPQGV